MRCLIRVLGRGGMTEERWIEAPEISLGRAEDQDIRLSSKRCGFRHAVIAIGAGGEPVIRALSATGLEHNGRSTDSAALKAGDQLRLGGVSFAVAEPEQDAELCLVFDETRISRGNELEEALWARSDLDDKKPLLSMRALAWGLTCGILLLFLLAPLLGFVYKPLGAWFRTIPMVSDLVWSSGPLVPAHKFMAEDCNRCHEVPFVSVRNSACTACHRNMPHHLAADFDNVAKFEPTRCAACHKEHSDPRTFVRHDEKLCVDCHADIHRQSANTQLLNVTSFGDGHPEFRASLPVYMNGQEKTLRVAVNDKAALREHSHLEFGHADHLRKDGVEKPSGEKVKMDCADCHRPEPGGAGMARVEFEKHCHQCHKLNFESDDPGREVPHGDDTALKSFLEVYYAERALRGGYQHLSAPLAVQERRRPGETLTPEQRSEALEWVKRYSREVGSELLRYRLCATCHTVSQSDAGSGLPWKVEPLRINARWFPKARFSHDQHKTEKCADCHDVLSSKDSADVLLTGIATCRKCHGGADASDRLPSTCVDCHGFHVSTTLTMDGKKLPAVKPPAGSKRRENDE